MNDTARRTIGYSLGSVVLTGLAYVGFVYDPGADPMTLLGSVEVHLKLASSFPQTDRKGNPNPLRANLMREAREFLAKAREQAPELFLGFEYEGWLRGLEGDYAGAAAMYNCAQSGEGATRTTKEADLLNEVRMWRAAKDPKRAIAAMDRWHGGFFAENASTSVIERMLALEDMGDEKSAVELAVKMVSTCEEPMPLMDAGHYLQRVGKSDIAEQAYTKAAGTESLANYFLASLKVRGQQYDSALELLNRAVATDGRRVRVMLKRDAKIWKPVENDNRFMRLNLPVTEAAKPGR